MEYLAPYISAFENRLSILSQNQGRISNLYEPVSYILSLGGKRLRPIFLLMACDLYAKSFEKALPAAGAIEEFHNFTLMHDDIMDNAFVRRGKATVHEKYSVNQAILSGDVMMIRSFEALLSYTPVELSHRLLEIMAKMAIALCEGQQRDMDFETEDAISIQDYLEMIENKTAVLLGAALQMGALIGGAKASDAEHLYQFGKNFGIAFQLQDDVLDTFGTSEQVGKKIGGDIIQNKKTYLYLKALELADENKKEELISYYTGRGTWTEDEKIQAVTKIFTTVGVREYATIVMEAYRDLAISHAAQCQLGDEQKKLLTTLVNDLLYRDH